MEDIAGVIFAAIVVMAIWLVPVVIKIKQEGRQSASRQNPQPRFDHADERSSAMSMERPDYSSVIPEQPLQEGEPTVRNLHFGNSSSAGEERNRKKAKPAEESEEQLKNEDSAAEHIRQLLADDIQSVVITSEILENKYQR